MTFNLVHCLETSAMDRCGQTRVAYGCSDTIDEEQTSGYGSGQQTNEGE